MWALGQEHHHILPAKNCFKTAFFCHIHLLQVLYSVLFCFIWLRLAQNSAQFMSCLWKAQLKIFFNQFENRWRNWNMNTKILTTKPFARFIRFIFHITVIEIKNKLQNDLTKREAQPELRTGLTSHLHAHYIHWKRTYLWESEPYASNLPSVQLYHLAGTSLLCNAASFFVAVRAGGFHSLVKTVYDM
jgi:hypothetical protein